MERQHEPVDEATRITQFAATVDPRRLELIIMPTEKCNFRCTYCYEDFSIGRMSPKTVRAVKLLLDKRVPHLRELRLSWFGGEPLVARDICVDISEHALRLANAHRVSFYGAVTTNGWFLELPLVRKLLAAEQRNFQVTFDGFGEVHDKTRVRPDGKGTFDKIWANLMAMAHSDLEFSVMLRLHLMPHNLHGQVQLIEKIDAELGEDPRFQILYHAVSQLGGPNAGTFQVLSGEEYSQRLAELRKSSRLKWTSETQVLDEGAICYAARANSLVVRASGKLAKCTVALTDDRNDVGQIQEDGTVHINSEKVKLWMSGFEEFDRETLGCPLSTLDARSAGKFKDIPVRRLTQ
jgi:uncharacterized protein